MGRLVAASALLPLALLISSPAIATDFLCESRDAVYMTEHSDLVLLSRLVKVVENPDDDDLAVARLAVLKRWKGPDLQATVDVVWNGDAGVFLPGVTYLVYAKRASRDRWHVASNVCGNRVLLPHAAESHFAVLGLPEWDVRSGGTAEQPRRITSP